MAEATRAEALFLAPEDGARSWLSLCGSLLFLWPDADSRGLSSVAPHMFLDLTKTWVQPCKTPLVTEESGQTATPEVIDATAITLLGVPESTMAPGWDMDG